MKLLLLNPPVFMKNVYGTMEKVTSNVPPQGLCQIASSLREKRIGVNLEILDARVLGFGVKETVKRLMEIKPDILGLTLFTSNLNVSSFVVKDYLKEIKKKVLVVGGGPDPTFHSKHFIENNPEFDLCVIGEGEETIAEIVECYMNGRAFNEVNGIMFVKDGQIIKTPRRESISNLDSLPLPSWDLLPKLKGHYRLSGCKVRSHKEGVSIITSRGCPGKCNFCNPRGLGFGIRFNSAEYIMKVVEDLYDNFGIRELYIQDDMFTANRDNVLRFCALLQQSRFNIPWTCNARVDFIDTELLTEMKKAGCWQIGFGFESGSQKILDTIGKKVTVEDNYKCTLYCKEVGMEVMGLFMIGCFNETEESMMETLNFIKKSYLTDLQVTYYTPLPGTASWKQWPKFGDFDQNTDIAFHTEPAFVPYGMTKEQLIAYQKKMYFRFYMNPRTLFKYFANLFKPDVSMRFIQTLIGFVSFLFIKNKSKINFLKTRINE